jgi:D-glycero-alpha-D-manno-heptose 1-phosphate guanylyltransferase
MRVTADIGTATAVLLAGGLGTRLRSVVADRPKVLAPVAGRPFLAWLLDQVSAAGIRRAVVCTGYLAEQVEAAFGDRHGDVALTYSREAEPLGTGGALRHALAHLGPGPCVVLNGDSCCATPLAALWQHHAIRGARATLLATLVPDAARFGRLEADATGNVTGFVEKDGRRGPAWINAGVAVVARGVIERIPAGRPVSLEREVWPALVGRGLLALRRVAPFVDIGTPEDFALAARVLAPAGVG